MLKVEAIVGKQSAFSDEGVKKVCGNIANSQESLKINNLYGEENPISNLILDF